MLRLRDLRFWDYMILVIISIFVVLVWAKIEGGLRYHWRWHVIPNYIFRYDQSQGRWVAGTLFNGLLTTIRICIYATVLAVILGTILGVARCSQTLVTRMLARTYVEVLRNIPPVVVIFIFFFFLSEQIISALNVEGWARGIARQENNGIWMFFFGDMRQFPSLVSGVMVLALFESAFIGEIIRAGIQSISKGQTEAAQSLGMGTLDLLRFIILPQAIHKVLPPLASQFITLIKDSTIISLISVHDLTYSTVELVVSTHAIFEAWLSTAAMYFLLCLGMSLLFRRLEKRGP